VVPLLYLALVMSASAGKKDRQKAATPAAPKALEQVLTEAGWTITPERSSTYNAGDIYDMNSHSKVATREQCFEDSPEEGVYTSLHVVQAMHATANVRLGVVKLQGGGAQYKQRTFAEPYLSELPRMSQRLTEECAAYLRTEQLDGMAVLTAVLSAEVKEENCTTVEGGASVAGVGGGELGVRQQCLQESAGHVAIAYKTRPMSELLASAPQSKAPATDATEFAAIAAKAEAAKAQRDLAEAQRKEKLDAATAELLASAAADWAAIESIAQTGGPEASTVLGAFQARWEDAVATVEGRKHRVAIPQLDEVRGLMGPQVEVLVLPHAVVERIPKGAAELLEEGLIQASIISAVQGTGRVTVLDSDSTCSDWDCASTSGRDAGAKYVVYTRFQRMQGDSGKVCTLETPASECGWTVNVDLFSATGRGGHMGYAFFRTSGPDLEDVRQRLSEEMDVLLHKELPLQPAPSR